MREVAAARAVAPRAAAVARARAEHDAVVGRVVGQEHPDRAARAAQRRAAGLRARGERDALVARVLALVELEEERAEGT